MSQFEAKTLWILLHEHGVMGAYSSYEGACMASRELSKQAHNPKQNPPALRIDMVTGFLDDAPRHWKDAP